MISYVGELPDEIRHEVGSRVPFVEVGRSLQVRLGGEP